MNTSNCHLWTCDRTWLAGRTAVAVRHRNWSRKRKRGRGWRKGWRRREVTAIRGKASRPTKRSWRRSKDNIEALISVNNMIYNKVTYDIKNTTWTPNALCLSTYFSFLGSAERQSCVKPTGMQRLQRRPPWFYSVTLFALPSVTQHWTA